MQNLKRICESDLSGDYDLEIVDVLERPQIAEDQKVLVTPTVDRILPPPIRRIIGDLSDKDKVLVGLELEQVVS
jgi:circadian clock protein KaiB